MDRKIAELSEEISRSKPTKEYCGWIFDQLIGANYSLIKCHSMQPPKDDTAVYREKVYIKKLFDERKGDEFLWGFYLNSAIHRIVWVCERLMLDIAFPAPSDQARNPSWLKIRSECRKKCLGEDESKEEPECKPLRKILKQFDAKDCFNCDPVNDDNIIAILRNRLNRQKHWSKNASGLRMSGDQSKGVWVDLKPERQKELTLYALELVFCLYKSLEIKNKPGLLARADQSPQILRE